MGRARSRSAAAAQFSQPGPLGFLIAPGVSIAGTSACAAPQRDAEPLADRVARALVVGVGVGERVRADRAALISRMMRRSAWRVAASISTSPTRYTLIAFGGHPLQQVDALGELLHVRRSAAPSRLHAAATAPRRSRARRRTARTTPHSAITASASRLLAEARAGDHRAGEPVDQRLQRQRFGDRAQEAGGAAGVEHEEGDERRPAGTPR